MPHKPPSEGLSEALKPCPFCGGEARLFEQGSGWATVACAAGHHNCALQPHVYTKRSAAIVAWNRREEGRSASPVGVGEGSRYTIDQAKREAAKGDLSGLIELAGLAGYYERQWKTWVQIARGMGYENPGQTFDTAVVGPFVAQQIVRQRARVASAPSAAPAQTQDTADLAAANTLMGAQGGPAGSAPAPAGVEEALAGARWITVEAAAALYVDHGRDAILCDRLPRPITLVLNLTDEDRAALSASPAPGVGVEEVARIIRSMVKPVMGYGTVGLNNASTEDAARSILALFARGNEEQSAPALRAFEPGSAISEPVAGEPSSGEAGE